MTVTCGLGGYVTGKVIPAEVHQGVGYSDAEVIADIPQAVGTFVNWTANAATTLANPRTWVPPSVQGWAGPYVPPGLSGWFGR